MKIRRNARVEALRQQAVAAGWSRERLVDEIHQHLGVSLLLAHRLASGRTQAETARLLRELYAAQFGEAPKLSHQQVSKWENGTDKPEKYLDVLCRLYKTRPDRLGLGSDYGSESPIGDPPATDPSRLHRRKLLSLPLSVAASQGLADLESVRLRLDGLVQKTTTPVKTLEHWEEEISHLGVQIRVMEPGLFLVQATNAMKALCDMFESRQSLEAQRRLCESLARLAGLIAIDCNATANVLNMHSWFHLAQTLADECGDRTVRSWALAYEAMSYLWHGKSLNRALDLAQRARSMAPKGSASAPLAASIEARALARQGRAAEALAAMDAAEITWTQLDPPTAADESTFGFYEHLLRLYQSDVLTVLGVEFGRAREVQERAIGLARSKPGDIDTALVRLDQAMCLAKQKELSQGCRIAIEAINAVPHGFKPGTLAQKARGVVDQIVVAGGRKLVEELEEMLRDAHPATAVGA
ncbi:MAG TPA: hypothetical protein VFC19_08170 [Candidatus Limnocylindrales bacterium]|nr:hypothetical protein [Candidatus Limnocylindrales bacterium]